MAALALAAGAVSAPAAQELVLFGTHASGPGIGFRLAHFDSATGLLGPSALDVSADAPSYFVLSADGRRLYACNSVPRGAVSAYAVDPVSGAMRLLNRLPSGGSEPCYIPLDRTGRHALVANYDSGSVAVFSIAPDGRLGARTALVRHSGHSIDPVRQSRAHAHSIIVDPENRYALTADLGEDRIYVYRFDERTGRLSPNDPPYASVRLGSGPRHLRFHPNGKWLYATAEMGGAVLAFNWDGERGTLGEIQSIPAIPPGYRGVNTTAELLIHPNGRFLYVSNRGPDTVGVFSIEPRNGRLSPVQSVPSGGSMPRNLTFDPEGRWLVVANHDGNNASVFRIDDKTGLLSPAAPPRSIPFPFGIRFIPPQ